MNRARRRPWYETAFQKDYLARYKHRSDAAAKAELPFILRALALPRGACVLDLCCGAGRHARALARAGYRVIGIDLSADLLRTARSESRGRAIRYLRADMRRLPLPRASVDGAINIFTSFGYFARDTENARVLAEVARVLKPGAPFVMDYLNLKPTLAALVPCSERVGSGMRVLECRHFDARRRRLVKTICIARRGRTAVLCESVRAYTPRELVAMFRRAGFSIAALYGSLCGAPFNAARSPRCVVAARKRPAKS
ncbi:MAG: methyltransferase domain-containing protein [Planctomycetota bacterium]|nr:methyltransferase domain-containing protein [Planctomycetota bacterium]